MCTLVVNGGWYRLLHPAVGVGGDDGVGIVVVATAVVVLLSLLLPLL